MEDEKRKLTIATFKSGITMVIHTAKRFAGDGEPKPLKKREGVCKYVGAAIKVGTGCRGAGRGSIWECTNPELTGKCAPLDILPLAEPGCVTCALCPLYQAAPEPTWVKLGINFASALRRWVMAGRPVRTQQQVNELLSVCKSCPFFVKDTKGDYCGKCGCPVNDKTDDPINHRNKLVMATETCPHDPPLWKD